jgi:hypothetical protein
MKMYYLLLYLGFLRPDADGEKLPPVLELDRAVERHRGQAGWDKRCMMTLPDMMTSTRPGDPLQEAGRELVLPTYKANNQVLLYKRAEDTAYNFSIDL